MSMMMAKIAVAAAKRIVAPQNGASSSTVKRTATAAAPARKTPSTKDNRTGVSGRLLLVAPLDDLLALNVTPHLDDDCSLRLPAT
jgi:hypothetical protein